MKYHQQIDGLRGLAIFLVVAYHLKIEISGYEILSTGFIGVDIFFVISGFLIGGSLYEELTATNRIQIGKFYQRRARRLLPSLVLVSTIVNRK